jgi:hypothetical protein
MSLSEEEARQQAEARRKRIMESAENRMGVIEGTPVAGAGAGADDADAGDGDAAPKKMTAGAARMAAMRKRRANKAAAAAEAGGATEETPAIAASEDDDKSKTDATTATEETVTTATEETATTTMDKLTSTEDSEKKYMGVAKMRRRKLMEKKLQDAQNEAPQVLSAANKKKKHKKSFLDRLPILMHAVTVLLLFVAGLDIGMQQHHDYGDDLVVHADFAPRQHGLLIGQKMKVPSFITKMLEKKAVVEKTIVDGDEQEDVPVIDEFGDDDKVDDTPDNLDPLFGIDLDKITAGPGALLFLARGAIFLHRLNLKVFYYFPRRTFGTIYGTIQQLVNTPPIMALTAITVRQLIGKVILGAKLPVKGKDEKKKTDVMSMGMNMVKTFILGAFPTLVSIYDGWTHLRADIYVVLCGLFVGVVWHHYVSPSDSSLYDVPESVSGSITGDEL